MLKRVPLIFREGRGYTLDLPTFRMIPGTFEPEILGVIHSDGPFPMANPLAVLALNPTVLAELPDDWPMLDATTLDARALRARYRDHPRFGTDAYIPPVLSTP